MERDDSIEIDHLLESGSEEDQKTVTHVVVGGAAAAGGVESIGEDGKPESGAGGDDGHDGHEGIDNWELGLALETVLAQTDQSTLERVLEICKGRRIPAHLRAQVWQLCLDVDEYSTKQPLVDIYDLPEQQVLRSDCQKFVETLSNTEEEDRLALTSDLESILTSYIKSTGINYVTNNGWLNILRPLLTLRLTNSQLYTAFRSLLRDYIPRDVANPEGLPFHIFRLLLQYHEPSLCTLLDSKRIGPFTYTSEWFRSLFCTSQCNILATIALWDAYFQHRDPFLIFHMALALVINAKDQVVELESNPDPKPAITKLLASLADGLEPDDVLDFVSISQHYALTTPNSYRRMFESALFGSESFLTFGSLGSSSTSPSRRVAMHSLCMPVSADELLDSIRMAKSMHLDYANVKFFVVDCRPHEQYNAGHLPTAFHLDCGLMLQEPVSFSTAVQGLLLTQKEAQQVNSPAGGEHLAFVGSGHEEEDQYVNMVVSSFLQKFVNKVGLVSGGYQALHELYTAHSDDEGLAEHDPTVCIECRQANNNVATPPAPPNKLRQSGIKLFSNTLGNWKLKTADLKGKLIDYMASPAATASTSHIKSTDKTKSKPYRNSGKVFSLEEQAEGLDDDDDTEAVGTRVHIKAWLKRSEVLGSYQCSEVLSTGDHYEGYVAVTPTKIYFLRETDERDIAEISVCRLLSSVVKITSKKKHPELITFKYGNPESATQDQVLVTHCDRFYLSSSAREFVGLVKKQIDERLNE